MLDCRTVLAAEAKTGLESDKWRVQRGLKCRAHAVASAAGAHLPHTQQLACAAANPYCVQEVFEKHAKRKALDDLPASKKFQGKLQYDGTNAEPKGLAQIQTPISDNKLQPILRLTILMVWVVLELFRNRVHAPCLSPCLCCTDTAFPGPC